MNPAISTLKPHYPPDRLTLAQETVHYNLMPRKPQISKKVQTQVPLSIYRDIVDLALQEHSTVRNVAACAIKLGLLQLATNPQAVEALPRDGRSPG